MFMPQTSSIRMADHAENRPALFIPMVYENSAPQGQRWEYRVLKIEARETDLPDEKQLNELGQEGWVLVGLLDERATSRGNLVYYYFARQSWNA